MKTDVTDFAEYLESFFNIDFHGKKPTVYYE